MRTEAGVKYEDLRFLVVDDQAFSRNLLRVQLRNLNVGQIDFAAHGEEALSLLQRNGSRVDVVISDWNMRPVDGLQLLQRVRTASIPEIPANLPFIMLTGYSNSTVVTAALNLDVDAYVVKPASTTKLEKAIAQALTRNRPAKPASFYLRIDEVPLPGNLQSPADDTSHWARWIKSGRPEVYDAEITFVRRERIDLSHVPENEDREITQVRYKSVDRIKPGAVLVEEVCDAEGAPLLIAGTILSEKILKRLSQMEDVEGEKMKLWVGKYK